METVASSCQSTGSQRTEGDTRTAPPQRDRLDTLTMQLRVGDKVELVGGRIAKIVDVIPAFTCDLYWIRKWNIHKSHKSCSTHFRTAFVVDTGDSVPSVRYKIAWRKLKRAN